MHGRQHRGGEPCRRRSFGQHMPATTARTVAAVDSSRTSAITADSFCKDGRKICVGDCALFKPPHDSPPFIGIIRCLISSKDNNLQLGVNWLYRPAELKLGKGILVDAAPNEIFYSFHRDEIPAASLLHPCKVAFLPKGVELPTGVSSFVCRRVYDIANKCLCLLTDQDYIDELQEEVDQLLHKTRVEMHASLQPGGRSPKPINGPMSTSQSKSGSENVQNNVTSFPSQVKGKKRERGDQASDSVKRERSLKVDDSDSGLYKTESAIKSEIAKITERGGLVDSEGVDKLVQLMQPDRGERKMDLVCRSLLASVVASTEKFDCLNRFVQLRGLLVLDEWLQDVHKGRISDGNPKDGDKQAEEFLLVLLRALDKLPVNLEALKMCNIGKSVNHLRSHKNMDIQKKARGLVDTWKKRVEVEMNMIDAKSTQGVAWPSKSRIPETSHSGNKNPGGSNDVTPKSSVTQISSKTASIKTSQVETTAKSASSSPGPVRSASSPVPGKDSQARVSLCGASDVPLMREDKSSSSSQSHNHSPSFSGKEDARSSTAGSMSSNKLSNSSSRHRKSINGFPGTSVSGSQKENGTGRSTSLHRNSNPEKLSQTAPVGDKTVDGSVAEGSSHKLIVKIPNRGRSPAQSASGGSYEEPNIMNSRASSPVVSEKHEHFDQNVKEKSDAYRSNVTSDVNAESWQSNDFKDILTGSDEGDGSPAALPDDDRKDERKSGEVSKIASSSSGTELKSGKLHNASFNSMNALIESCIKYSEANASMSLGDAVGMNLLASVATEEMSKSDMHSPSVSSQRNSPVVEETSMAEDSRSKPLPPPLDSFASDSGQRNDNMDCDNKKQLVSAGSSLPQDKLHLTTFSAPESFGERKLSVSPELMKAGEKSDKNFSSSFIDTKVVAEPNVEMNEMSGERNQSVLSPTIGAGKACDGESDKKFDVGKAVVGDARLDGLPDSKMSDIDTSLTEDKASNALVSLGDQKRLGEVSSSDFLFEGSNKKDVNRGLNEEVKSPAATADSEVNERPIKELQSTISSRDRNTDKGGDDEKVHPYLNQSERKTYDKIPDGAPAPVDKNIVSMDSTVNLKTECNERHADSKDRQLDSGGSPSQNEGPGFSGLVVEKNIGSRESKFSRVESDKTNNLVSNGVTSVAPETASKMKFDLNEGFVSDDVKCGEAISSSVTGYSSGVHVINPLPFSVSSVPTGLPASITVAAAAKGPFVPPEELLRFKGEKAEFGWKGSAATSAFRPAEPRKLLDTPFSSVSISHSETSSGKQNRPCLDIDLNVPDESSLEDLGCSALDIGYMSNHPSSRDVHKKEEPSSPSVRSSGGLDLDLNRADEPNDVGQCSISSSHMLGGPVALSKPLPSSRLAGEVRRDFDLNNGPGVDDASAEQSLFQQNSRGSMHLQPATSSLRVNNPEIGNFTSWFTPACGYSAVAAPSILPDRGDQPFPVMPPGGPRICPAPGGSTFAPDVYRGSVLSSSPAVPFPSGSYQFPMFPFGPTTFPLPSASFPVGSASYINSSSGGRMFTASVNSQLLGPVSAAAPQFPRPYMVGLPDSTSNASTDINRKWPRQGLDLNAGPGSIDINGRDESVPLAPRQLSITDPQALAEEHGIYTMGGNILKRKEPDGGWDNDSFRYKQSSWQ
nr:uncharacterized protein LOC109150871 isoform X1 [Ipomoea batatas]